MTDAANVRAQVVAVQALHSLGECARVNSEATSWAASAFLQSRNDGMPHIAASLQRAREDARFWAECARPEELECYLLAAADKLAEYGGLMAGRQIKRMSASLWGRMSPEEQKAFLVYIQRENQK